MKLTYNDCKAHYNVCKAEYLEANRKAEEADKRGDHAEARQWRSVANDAATRMAGWAGMAMEAKP